MKLCRALSDLVVYTNSVAAQDIVDDGKLQSNCDVFYIPNYSRELFTLYVFLIFCYREKTN